MTVELGLEAKTIFADLQRRYPGRFQDGQLRTLQRKVKKWRVLEGRPQEVFFPKDYRPGRLCQSDFTHLIKLQVLTRGEAFVVTYNEDWRLEKLSFLSPMGYRRTYLQKKAT